MVKKKKNEIKVDQGADVHSDPFHEVLLELEG